ncbi:hypothetical protein B0H17DRAFT_74222 [Mycena rosella]|uniref:Endoplasmic reticulum junction formation protein lunapark n=1 Tax=Mycena rosella TaxID=1033263 RepID=A0AAD7GBW8_MYCRO|nr:hypothetical protein B0H17DRAFT_74222 [Mycena rosella]
MSFLWRLFRASPPADDYESVLAALALDIAQRQSALAALRARERHASTLVTLYALAVWAAYLAVWYFGFVAGVRGMERALRALPVVVGPILIFFIRRIVQIWYSFRVNVEEKPLQSLLKQQRAKVEEIKKKTNFYSTRELLERYDGSAPNSPQRPGPASVLSVSQNGRPGAASASAAPSSSQQPGSQQQHPAQPAERKWFDALVVLLVGAADAGAGAGGGGSRRGRSTR